ncbi:hypothetical protein OTU49_006775 [Cherax quadricarinatus]|uniref:IGFBP N-terminal domain-containing protein n=1 Tax=Cherax quadricarinatus TaxID=27406 RepID=A0AAW0WNA7_CHEQU
MNTFTLLCLLFLAVTRCSGLTCLPCQAETQCPDSNTLHCYYGIVKDVCNCCDVCAKGPGEKCGGEWDAQGKCADGLTCQKTTGNAEGICAFSQCHHLPSQPSR